MQPNTHSYRTTPKDFFLNVGAILALYVSIISIISLLFSLVNRYFPDPSLYSYAYDDSLYTIRWTISCLIIAYPLYLVLSRYINKEIAITLEKKEVWVKKWSTYFTLFITGASIAGDLVVLVNTFLGGEITARFVLKVLIVLALAGYIFAYYFHDLKRTDYVNDKKAKVMMWLGSLLVIVTIIAGFLSVGSPLQERTRKIDDQRVQDLSSIQSYIVYTYWRKTGTLPDSLAVLNDPISSFAVPKDPETGNAYEYNKTGTSTFALCATFSLPSRTFQNNNAELTSINRSFDHGKGRTCFDRNIDPTLYPATTPSQVE